MKKLFVIIAALLFTSQVYSQQNTSKEFEKLKWLCGTWKRSNSKPGQSGTETWVATSPAKLTGKGVTMRGTDTAFVEKLSIVIKGGDIFYVADVSGNPEPVYFKMTTITADGFVCENPEHDFPKKIAYQLIGSRINASISGNGKNIAYNFERLK
ncbi:hypothetical protein HQ865_14770 [Mucilaginibacter mali]|uniref:DUF6265 domain-containing protein n=1 Tax=Mucilaginibacter mali TaxID=2740462 RepID=A0A7D4UDV0_9SPHI|nr:DUF6265 family protein [Mucilaginibacter mali]QKJ30959.1 hypothetical protein HQ865_14770 [Mucilaginibacter mali]